MNTEYKMVPDNCRQRMAREGKPYPRSSCEVCGQFSPKWKECDAMLAAAPVPPQGDAQPVAEWCDKLQLVTVIQEVIARERADLEDDQ